MNILKYVGFIISALAFYFSSQIGWLAWLGPLPILLIAPRMSVGLVFFGSMLSYWAGSWSWWAAESFVIPVWLFSIYHLFYALVFGMLMYMVRRTLNAWLFPLGWTSFEFLVLQFSPEGTWGSLAYSQFDYTALMQNASIFGILGIVFLVCSFPAAVAHVMYLRIKKRPVLRQTVFIIVVLATISSWGYFKIHSSDSAETIRIGITAANYTVPYEESHNSAANLAFIATYLDRVAAELAVQGAKIVVLPEKLVLVTADDKNEMALLFRQSAIDHQIFLVVGVKLREDGVFHNKAWVFSPTGEMWIDYNKRHLVPGLENEFAQGSTIATFHHFAVNIGIAICKDMDFPGTIRQYGQANTGAILVPAWDWKGSERIHARMAMVRGIENGFSVVRSSREGLVTVSDRFGRLLAEESTFRRTDASIVTDVPVKPFKTLYTRFGDWFGWLSIALFTLGFFLHIHQNRERGLQRSLNML